MRDERPPVCSITVPIHACMHEAGPPDAEGKRSVGHMHLCIATAAISRDNKPLGCISAAPNCTLVIEIGEARYHLTGIDVWEAVYTSLGGKL